MTGFRMAVRGPLTTLPADTRARLIARRPFGGGASPGADTSTDLPGRVAGMIARVQREGDAALVDLARKLDRVELTQLEVPRRVWDRAIDAVPPGVLIALERAAANIAQVHRAFAPAEQQVVTADGVEIGRRPDPLARVGVYAPGGRAAYPSSLLMGAVPARVAGVPEVIVCSPPQLDGAPSAIVLAAAAIGQVDRVFALGGAGAIAAMAYGTASVPRVERIVGPGNAYVAEAKLQVSRVVGIDAPAGPSELLVLADGSASPGAIARELAAQAEHDPDAAVVLVATDQAMLDAVAGALKVASLGAVAREALTARGALLFAPTIDDAIAFANEYAPEHLLLALAPDWLDRTLPRIRGAGSVFLGESSSVAFGDYLTGANHVLPTGGEARRWSGLSTDDFVRWTTWQRVSRGSARALARDTMSLAIAEGLPAHAAAAAAWEAA